MSLGQEKKLDLLGGEGDVPCQRERRHRDVAFIITPKGQRLPGGGGKRGPSGLTLHPERKGGGGGKFAFPVPQSVKAENGVLINSYVGGKGRVSYGNLNRGQEGTSKKGNPVLSGKGKSTSSIDWKRKRHAITGKGSPSQRGAWKSSLDEKGKPQHDRRAIS